MINDYTNLSDLELMALLKSGDHAAFSEIYNRHMEMVYAHCQKMLKNEEETQDLVQEIFISLWEKAPLLELKTNLSGYLFIATRHKVLNLMRKNRNANSLLDMFSLYNVSHESSTFELLCEKELAKNLEIEIANLPVKMRRVFEYSRKEYRSNREIAEQMGISDKTVKKQIGNAIKILKLKLSIVAHGLILYFILK